MLYMYWITDFANIQISFIKSEVEEIVLKIPQTGSMPMTSSP